MSSELGSSCSRCCAWTRFKDWHPPEAHESDSRQVGEPVLILVRRPGENKVLLAESSLLTPETFLVFYQTRPLPMRMTIQEMSDLDWSWMLIPE